MSQDNSLQVLKDMAAQDALGILVTAAEVDELDITYFDGTVKYDAQSDGFQIKSGYYNYCGIRDTVCSGEIFFLDLLKHHKMYYVVWLQMYRTSLLEALQMKYNVGFPHEDGDWSFKAMSSDTRVRRVQRSFYQRRISNRSLTAVKIFHCKCSGNGDFVTRYATLLPLLL